MSTTKTLIALALFAAFGAAQATVVKTVSGATTTYSENFNNAATSFSRGEYNASGVTDDYLWLTGSDKATWSFTSATALKSVTISFAYAVPGADTGFFKFASNSAITLADTPGTVAQFKTANPSIVAGASAFDATFSRTYTNLAAGSYTLSFWTDAPDCNALSGLKVDDLSVVTVSAVPEPQTYAMMFGGLIAIGFLARRRGPRHD